MFTLHDNIYVPFRGGPNREKRDPPLTPTYLDDHAATTSTDYHRRSPPDASRVSRCRPLSARSTGRVLSPVHTLESLWGPTRRSQPCLCSGASTLIPLAVLRNYNIIIA